MASKPFYRTLRGLDPYSDRFCWLLIRRLTRRTWLAGARFATVNILATLMTSVAWLFLGAVFAPIAYLALVPADGNRQSRTALQCAGAIGVALVAFAFGYRRAWRASITGALRDALRPRIIEGSRCMICRYSLDGLSGRDHLVVCPECGRTVPIGLGSVNLIEQMMARGELPPEGRFAPGPGEDGPNRPVEAPE